MKIHHSSSCFICAAGEDCELLAKLRKGIENIYTYETMIVCNDDKIDCYSTTSSFGVSYFISCGAIKKWEEDVINKVVVGLVFSGSSNVISKDDREDERSTNQENKESSEEKSFDVLSREDKVKRLIEMLKIDNPINIKISSQVNAWADIKDEIYITSAALDQLSFKELAFMIFHEKSHIDSKDLQHNLNLIDRYGKDALQMIATRPGISKTLTELIKIGITGFAAYVEKSQISEVTADVNAKLKLREMGYDETGGEESLERINNPVSFSHPSSNLRKEILKKV